MIKSMRSPQNTPQNTPNFFEYIPYPHLASPKLDGVRGSIQGNNVLSSTLATLPNWNLQERFRQSTLCGLQGEFVMGPAYAPDVFNKTMSTVMAANKPVEGLIFAVFDHVTEETRNLPFETRLESARALVKAFGQSYVVMVPQREIANYEELVEFEEEMLLRGYEGVMIRCMDSPYKEGRATLREASIFKLKRLEDSEGVVVGFDTGRHNTNPQERSEEGRAKRSYAAEGLIDSDMVGALLVEFNGQQIRVAPGKFKHHERRDMLQHPSDYIGRYVKFTHMPHGAKDQPRMARAVGWRDPRDMAIND